MVQLNVRHHAREKGLEDDQEVAWTHRCLLRQVSSRKAKKLFVFQVTFRPVEFDQSALMGTWTGLQTKHVVHDSHPGTDIGRMCGPR
ncbi:hypothetical protein MRX96_008883 [Rhipicephalus microplus]